MISKKAQARGIRNNNPGNIRHGSDVWQGMSRAQPDAAFVRFDSPVWGVRAMARVLMTYRNRYGLQTVRDIITRWAPPTENNTAAYVFAVSQGLGVDPDAPLQFPEQLPELVAEIIKHENGYQPYTMATIKAGIERAQA